MRDEPDVELKCRTVRSSRSHKRCWLIQTAGRWSWKSKSAKKCVTTYLPNQLALKMDGAEAYDLDSTVCAEKIMYKDAYTSRRAWTLVEKRAA